MPDPTLAPPAIWIPPAAARLAQARGNTVEVYPGGEVRMLADGGGRSAKGHDGVYVQSGEVEDEHNPNLAPEFWRGCDNERGVYDKMIAEDPTAQAIRFARILPLAATEFRVEPYADRDGTVQPWAQEQADFIETALFRLMHPGWTETKAQIAEFSGRGARYFEPVFRRDRELERVVLDCLALRPLRSVDKWLDTPDGWAMEQAVLRGDAQRGGAQSSPVIPAEDLIGFRFFPQGSSPEPQGLFRPMYGPWKRRSTLARYEIQGANRYAYPVPVITIDPSNPNFTPGDRTKANNIAREFRAGVRAFVAMPPGYSIDFKTADVDLSALRASYNADGREMARAGLANHLFTGEANGTQALFTGQFGGMFKQSLQYDANTIAAVLSEGPRALLRRLVVLNFGKQPGYPRLVAGEVPVGDPLAVVQAVASMAEKRVIEDTDRKVEDHIRTALSLPERPEPLDPSLVPGALAPAGDSEDIAKTAFNGAQVTAALTIPEKVTAGALTREQGKAAMLAFFPLTPEQVDGIIDGAVAAKPKAEPTPDDEPDPDTPKPAGKTKARADETGEAQESDKDIEAAPEATAEALAERAMPDRPATGPRDRAIRVAETVVRLSETTGVVTQGKSAVAGVIVDWQERVAPAYAALVSQADSLDAAAKVPVPHQAELQKELADALRGVYAAGGRSAVAELRRIERDPGLARRIEEQELDRGLEGDIAAPVTFAESRSFPAPAAGIAELRRGLEWVAEGHAGDGLKSATVAAARRIVDSRRVSAEKVRKMGPWLARHEADKDGEGFSRGEDGYPSPGRVAWALWMGDPGVAFARRAAAALETTASECAAGCGCHAPSLLGGIGLQERVEESAAFSLACVAFAEDKAKAPKPAKGQPPSDFDDIDPEASIRAVAATTTRAVVARMVQAATNALQGQSLGGSIEAIPAAERGAIVGGAVAALSPGPLLNQAQGDVNTVFGLGRQQEQRALGVERYMYSNLLESQSCENCASFDGTIFGADELDTYATPAVWCEGGDRCNCLVIGLPRG